MTGYKGTPASSQIIWLEEEVERLSAENEKLREETRSKGERIGGYVNMLVKREAEIEKLRAALKPFAELAEYYDVEPDAQPAWDRDFQPTVGELRAAAAALKETGDE